MNRPTIAAPALLAAMGLAPAIPLPARAEPHTGPVLAFTRTEARTFRISAQGHAQALEEAHRVLREAILTRELATADWRGPPGLGDELQRSGLWDPEWTRRGIVARYCGGRTLAVWIDRDHLVGVGRNLTAVQLAPWHARRDIGLHRFRTPTRNTPRAHGAQGRPDVDLADCAPMRDLGHGRVGIASIAAPQALAHLAPLPPAPAALPSPPRREQPYDNNNDDPGGDPGGDPGDTGPGDDSSDSSGPSTPGGGLDGDTLGDPSDIGGSETVSSSNDNSSNDGNGGGDGGGGGHPIILDLDGDGVEIVALRDSTAFYDINGDGYRNRMSWPAPDDGLLAYDKDGDGRISAHDELSFTSYVEGARTDLEGLRHFDTNADGRLDPGDAEWGKFRVWQDLNQDGKSDPGELRTLDEATIESVSLTSDGVERTVSGNRIFGEGRYRDATGERAFFDASLRYSTRDTRKPAAVDMQAGNNDEEARP